MERNARGRRGGHIGAPAAAGCHNRIDSHRQHPKGPRRSPPATATCHHAPKRGQAVVLVDIRQGLVQPRQERPPCLCIHCPWDSRAGKTEEELYSQFCQLYLAIANATSNSIATAIGSHGIHPCP